MYIKNIYRLAFTAMLFITSCEKVSNLSDNADIKSFTVTSHAPSDIQLADALLRNDSVFIPVVRGRNLFPLKIIADIKVSKTTDEIFGIDFKDTLTFEEVNEVKEFYLIAKSGVSHKRYLIAKDIANAEITDFNIPAGQIENAVYMGTTFREGEVRIKVMKDETWPVLITPDITITPGAYFGGSYKPGDTFTFNSYDDVKTITVISNEGDPKIWNLRLTTIIENSDFELWGKFKDINPGAQTIDPIPGKGLGWATANNPYVQGTAPIPHGDGLAAEIKTTIRHLGFIGIGDLVTAGTLYLGYFEFSLQLDKPRSMAYFGIPFTTTPRIAELEAKYQPGARLQQAVKKGSRYELEDRGGTDAGHIWVELLHWAGEGPLAYHADSEIPLEGLTILGRGEHTFDHAHDWKLVQIPINYYNTTLKPTHIAILISSSKGGEKFLGAEGSVLCVDNVRLIY